MSTGPTQDPTSASGDPGTTFRFSAELWESAVEGATWVFVTLPVEQADDIADLAPHRAGFGSVRVEVSIGATTWRTSLFPDTKAASYVLPVKQAVRTAERVGVGDTAELELFVVLDGA